MQKQTGADRSMAHPPRIRAQCAPRLRVTHPIFVRLMALQTPLHCDPQLRAPRSSPSPEALQTLPHCDPQLHPLE